MIDILISHVIKFEDSKIIELVFSGASLYEKSAHEDPRYNDKTALQIIEDGFYKRISPNRQQITSKILHSLEKACEKIEQFVIARKEITIQEIDSQLETIASALKSDLLIAIKPEEEKKEEKKSIKHKAKQLKSLSEEDIRKISSKNLLNLTLNEQGSNIGHLLFSQKLYNLIMHLEKQGLRTDISNNDKVVVGKAINLTLTAAKVADKISGINESGIGENIISFLDNKSMAALCLVTSTKKPKSVISPITAENIEEDGKNGKGK